MRQFYKLLFIAIFSVIWVLPALAQDDVTIVAPTNEVAENLDLNAVAELFKDSENLEAFEKALNDEKNGINNLDLNDDGEVDFIRVVEQVQDETHVIILQVPLGEDDFQDVATIEIEKAGDEQYNMQVHGESDFYGPNYYIVPAPVHIHMWPILSFMYRPVYHPYRSVYIWGAYPRWWHPWHPVAVHVYRTRTVHYTTRKTFVVHHTTRVHTVSKVKYTPRSSTKVKRTRVTRTTDGTKTTKRGTQVTRERKDGTKTTVTRGVKKTKDSETGKTTKKRGVKVTREKDGKKTTVKRGHKTTRERK